MTTTRRTPGVHSRPRPFGPNGERLCYNCLGPLPKGRRYNCSSVCSQEWVGKTSPSRMRYLVRNRDKGVCAICGLDTIALKKQHDALGKQTDWDWSLSKAQRSEREKFRTLHGIPPGRSYGEWWDADHITPVVEGGGECGLGNYRTLCIPCHKKETAELAKRRARKRIATKVLPLIDNADSGQTTDWGL